MNIQEQILKAFGNNIKKDFFYNKEEFKKGNINLLFIAGFSGSGKTTLSYTARKIPNVEVIEHDLIDDSEFLLGEHIREQGKLLYSFYKNYSDCYGNHNFKEVYYKLNKYAIEYAKQHKNKVFIIEGTRSLNPFLKWNDDVTKEFVLPKENLKNIAIIIKHTNLLKSYFRAIKRNAIYKNVFKTHKEKNIIKIIIKFFRSLFNKRRWKYYKNAKRWFKEIKELL